MDFGAHLPLMDFGGHPFTLEHLVAYTETAAQLGFRAVSVNDHMVFSVPWLDGPTALAAVMEHSGDMTLATTVALAVVRGPVPLAKTLAAIDRLSGGRLIVAVGPGSSPQDYEAVGIDFDERWQRFDEAIQALRALWRRDGEPFIGRFYSTDGISLVTATRATRWPADLARKLGFRRGAPSRRSAGRRVAGFGVQHHPRFLRHRLDKPSCPACRLTTRTLTRSRTRSRRCGATSPTTAPRPSASCESVSYRPFTGLRKCCVNACRSGHLSSSPKSSPPSREQASSASSSGPLPTNVHQLELFWNRVQPLIAP